jgi:competence protein ComEC
MTRFRAYQLGNAGSSFSYFNGTKFTLLEARYNDVNEQNIRQELEICQTSGIHTLHITSWDLDHCSPSQLEKILLNYSPQKIEYPGYSPHSA